MEETKKQEITLEKIDLLRARMNVGYKEAREALELSQGDLVLALIQMEEKAKEVEEEERIIPQAEHWKEEMVAKGGELIEKIKCLVAEGNATKIRIKQEDRIILDIPVLLGTAGVLLVPQLAAVGAIAALFSQVTIEVQRQGKPAKPFFQGQKVKEDSDLSNVAEDLYEQTEEIIGEIAEAIDGKFDSENEEEEPQI